MLVYNKHLVLNMHGMNIKVSADSLQQIVGYPFFFYLHMQEILKTYKQFTMWQFENCWVTTTL